MEPLIFFIKVIGFGTAGGIAAIVISYILMCILGFTCGGVRKSSAAASYQTPYTDEDSCFACCQSSGAGGCRCCWQLFCFLLGFALTAFLMVRYSDYLSGGGEIVTLDPNNSTEVFNSTTSLPLML